MTPYDFKLDPAADIILDSRKTMIQTISSRLASSKDNILKGLITEHLRRADWKPKELMSRMRRVSCYGGVEEWHIDGIPMVAFWPTEMRTSRSDFGNEVLTFDIKWKRLLPGGQAAG